MQQASAFSQQQAAQKPVRPVGVPPAETGKWWRGQLGSMVLAGLAGGALAWIVTEILLQPDSESGHWYGNSGLASNLAFGLTMTLIIGLVIVLWDAMTLRSVDKAKQVLPLALPILIGAGLLGSYLADKVYEPASKHAVEKYLQTGDISDLQNALYMPRAIAIGIIGLSCGAALGAASRSPKRALYGGIGGVIGGFLGGLLFNWMTGSASSGVVPRLIAIVIVGTLIGLGVGLVEQVTREHWLEVVSGGMAGKQFILYNPITLIGSSPTCQITLVRDPYLSEVHCRLERHGDDLLIEAAGPVMVDGQQASKTVLHDGATVQVGTTLLRYGKRSASSIPTGPIQG